MSDECGRWSTYNLLWNCEFVNDELNKKNGKVSENIMKPANLLFAEWLNEWCCLMKPGLSKDIQHHTWIYN